MTGCTDFFITMKPSVTSSFLLCCFSSFCFDWHADLLPSNELDRMGRLIYLRECDLTLQGKQKAQCVTVFKAKQIKALIEPKLRSPGG